MSLTFYYHPLASFCHKVLIALYEHGTPFDARVVDLADAESSAELVAFWPLAKIPLLRDAARDRTVPETSIIIEYLEQYHPGPAPLVPADADRAREARLWDRVFDQYVMAPMQKIVTDRLRPSDGRDPVGEAEAGATLQRAYAVVERRLEGRTWAIGEDFSIADCAAAPALFYAGMVCPFADDYPRTAAYFERLTARASFARVLREARPYFSSFPYRERIPARFLEGE